MTEQIHFLGHIILIMTQEEKQLLLVDLCARLPYGTICEDIYGNLGTLLDLAPELNSVTLKISELGSTWTTDIDKVKPYLRPLSSMTEHEKETYQMFFNEDGLLNTSMDTYLDWLLEGHFDYRGLIHIGLALEAPENFYNN